MDSGSWKDMPDGLRDFVRQNWAQLCAAWDQEYPYNPIHGNEVEDDETKRNLRNCFCLALAQSGCCDPACQPLRCMAGGRSCKR